MREQAYTSTGSTAPERIGPSRLARSVVAGPDVVLVLFLAACVAVTVALTLRLFEPWLVGPLFVVLAVALVRFLPRGPAASGRQVTGALVSLLGAALWLVVNLPYAAQLLWVTRDPAIYTILGVWLGHHRTLDVDPASALTLAHHVAGTSDGLSPLLPDASGIMHGQGGVALPGLLGVGSWVGGLDGVLRTNLCVGAIALVGLYALARRFVGPWLALAAQAALGLAVPFLYLTRAPYSESIMLIAAIGALVWYVGAVAEDRWGLAVVGGLFLGAASMARIDGPIALTGVAAMVAVRAIVVRRADLASDARISAAFLGSGLLASLLGVLSLVVEQRRYLGDLRSQALLVWAASFAAIGAVVAIRLVRALAARRRRFAEVGDGGLRRAGLLLGLAVPLLFAVWWSRPAWWQGHFVPPHSAYFNAVEAWQRQSHQPVDGTRSYDEYTVRAVGWYFGWVTLVLGALGLGSLLRRGIARRDAAALAVVIPTAVAGVLYFDKLSVTPDQVWAYRRLLPIITPGILLGTVALIEQVLRRTRRLPALPRYGVPALAVAAMLAGPVLSWNSLTTMPEGDGDLAVTRALCSRLAGPVVLVAEGHAPNNIAATVRTVCGRQVVTGPAKRPAYLRRLAAHARDVQVVAFDPADLPHATRLGRPDVQGRHRYWRHTLVSPPDTYDEVEWRIWVGRVEDGRFVQDAVPR